VNQENLAAVLSGIEDPSVWRDPVRFTQTQVDVAKTPAVKQRVSRATGIPFDRVPTAEVVAKENSDILEFAVTHRDPALAARLATEYGRQFTRHRYELDTAALERAREEVVERMAEVRRESGTGSPFYGDLREKEQQLRTMEALQTSNASVVREADDAVQISPQPVRDGILGLGLGLVLGLALAFLWDTLDTRVRSGEEIGELLALPLLARLPEPPRRLQRDTGLVMVEQPNGLAAEAFRMLRTNLDFVSLSRRALRLGELAAHAAQSVETGAPEAAGSAAAESVVPVTARVPAPFEANGRAGVRSIMITSAVQREGKSTTVANLAVALARAGRHVVLVDLDLRRPFLHEFFRLDPRPGITDVALGEVDLNDALAVESEAPEADSTVGAAGAEDGRVRVEAEGVLEILTSGSAPPDAGEFVGTRALAEILAQLRQRADVVLVDAPPMLHLGDAMTLSATVDAVIVVARLGVVRRPMLTEVRRLLEAAPAEKLGFIVTAADLEKGAGYGYGYGYGYYYGRRRDEAAALPAPRR